MGIVRKAVIPVAGLGTRGLPFTKEVPKELLPIIDTPTIHFIVEEVLSAGIEQVIFITGKGKGSLEDYFDMSPGLESWLMKRGKTELAERIRRIGQLCEIVSVRQKEPLGLGHAVLCARNIVGNEPFAVCLGDEIFPPWDEPPQSPALTKLAKVAQESGNSVVGVVDIPIEDSLSYGIIDTGGVPVTDAPVLVKGTVEKPKPDQAPSHFAIIGRYVFQPQLMECLGQVKPGVGGEIQLTDAMDMLARQGKLSAQKLTQCRYDIGNHVGYLTASAHFALRRPELAARYRQRIQELLGK